MSIMHSSGNLRILKVVFACIAVLSVIMLVADTFGLNAYVVMSNSMRHKGYDTALYSFWESLGYPRDQFNGFPVSGGFQAGDLILAIKTEDLKVGDVAIDTRRDVPVTHRIFSINGATIMTSGDGLPPQNASRIPSSEIRQRKTIYGKVVLVVPKGGILKALDNCLRSSGCDMIQCFVSGECGDLH